MPYLNEKNPSADDMKMRAAFPQSGAIVEVIIIIIIIIQQITIKIRDALIPQSGAIVEIPK